MRIILFIAIVSVFVIGASDVIAAPVKKNTAAELRRIENDRERVRMLKQNGVICVKTKAGVFTPARMKCEWEVK